ncbi:Precorrin-6A reductase [Jannaschia seosinensis]|uniref:Precorrin-6A reductase n=1 Tax=Jannaschia seosinensis TaxID=313367 RepID=A0A0M7BFD8_9RHOB|nr:precorrin-6A/cobalt-precorrin-6A reductase [Jannaschia seosinensis]CUH40899.1 Precorrin-6A reductase [Jannaschia seosinensis]
MKGRVLILGGTAPARLVCAEVSGLDVVASLAGVTDAPARLAVPVRIGGFGGEAGFRAALGGVSAVLDATHPFAARISARAVRVCGEMGLPYLRLTRPPWPTRAGWRHHADGEAAAAAIAAGARVFLSTGPGSLPAFEERRLDITCRRIDPAPERAGVRWILGRPPFTLEAETALFATLGITDLVTKNAGGPAPKLDAAGVLGLRVHVIDRPRGLGGEETHDIDRAIAFVRTHAADRNRG